ncbi:MAG: hemolysin III family protein [Paludibacteraceae bacterium]|nr:hemolysin III family protein [Paludibacteraceae bacterium]
MSYAISREELANSLTHLLGVIMAPFMLLWLIYTLPVCTWQNVFPVTVFCTSVFFMYLASTAYHFVISEKAKRILRYCDHINIYVLIAASYTPVFICGLGGVLGWTMFGVEWTLAVAGAIYKIFCLGKYPKVSLLLYILMGWSVVAIIKPVWELFDTYARVFMCLEAFAYTMGAYFYANSKKHAYFHAIWHVFVLVGTIAHFFLVMTLFWK